VIFGSARQTGSPLCISGSRPPRPATSPPPASHTPQLAIAGGFSQFPPISCRSGAIFGYARQTVPPSRISGSRLATPSTRVSTGAYEPRHGFLVVTRTSHRYRALWARYSDSPAKPAPLAHTGFQGAQPVTSPLSRSPWAPITLPWGFPARTTDIEPYGLDIRIRWLNRPLSRIPGSRAPSP
jgi:hypothetical protein